MGLASVARGHGGFQFERPERRDLRQRLQCTGFVIPSEVPNEEIVISVAGRFWRPDGGRCMGLAAKDFAPFSRSGFAKVSTDLQTASRFAAKFGSFNGDEDPVFRTGRSVEISPLLEFG